MCGIWCISFLQSPPEAIDIEVDNETYNSVGVSWKLPEFENTSRIQYILQISSSQGSRQIPLAGTSTSHLIGQLEPDSMYSVALQVIDTSHDIAGMFGSRKTFVTKSGIPSEPRFLQVYLPNTTSLTVVWVAPETPNGTLKSYEVVYSGSVENSDCDKAAEEKGIVEVAVDKPKFETRDFEFEKFLIVCVRARTNQPGRWAFDTLTEVTIGANTGRLTGSGDECNGVIAIAVVAGLAVISCIIALIVLACVCRSAQVMDKSLG